MSQTTRITSLTNRTDDTIRTTKKPSETLRPHYYTTFQNSCCATKANSTTTTTTTPSKDVLPIPMVFKTDAEKLIAPLNGLLIEKILTVASYSSVIPNIFFEKIDDYQVQKYLFDRVMLRTLEDADIINWNIRLKKLYPIRTSGNGNCPLHAVLIAMIGIHDTELYLRDRLSQFMIGNQDLLKSHWRIERMKFDKSYGISTEDSKLDDEWKELCDLVRYENSEDGQATHLQFLEAVHIFAISNMLQRPIIILSEDVIRNKNGEAISVNDLYGIYLPIFSTPSECINEPIVLAYDRSYFCPLQTSDINRENILDNLLPLYPSMNHILERILLPIRFLGEDINAERSEGLLREYLRIKEVDHSFDSKSPAISIMCAELGSKHLPTNDSFFLIYYDYLIDFFKVQKPKFIEEEQKRERQREFDEYRARHPSYDIYDRPITSLYSSPTRLSRLDDTLLRDQNHGSYSLGGYSSGTSRNGAYIPTTGGFHFENGSSQSQLLSRSSDYGKPTYRDSLMDSDYYRSIARQSPRSNLYIIDNPTNSSKMMSRMDIQINGNNPKSSQERPQSNVVQIPVQIIRPSVSSNDSDLTIYERGQVTRNVCVLCDKIFDDRDSKHICFDCDYKMRYPTSYDSLPSRPSTARSGSANLYMPTSDHGYTSIKSPTPKARSPPRKIICPHCKNQVICARSVPAGSGRFISVPAISLVPDSVQRFGNRFGSILARFRPKTVRNQLPKR